jgi:hypothetical protein
MALLIQLVVVVVCCGILIGIARAMPVADPWIRWGVYAIAGLVVVGWLLGVVGVLGPTVPWRLHY